MFHNTKRYTFIAIRRLSYLYQTNHIKLFRKDRLYSHAHYQIEFISGSGAVPVN